MMRASLSERMTEAEVQLRAAQRIMVTNERHLALLQSRLRFRVSDSTHVESLRLRERIDDAEAAARAAGRQLKEIEEEMEGYSGPQINSRAAAHERLPTPRSPYSVPASRPTVANGRRAPSRAAAIV